MKYLQLGGCILLCFAVVFLLYKQNIQIRVAYASSKALFNGFDGQKELAKQLLQYEQIQQQALDSALLLANGIDPSSVQYERVLQDYQMKRLQLQQELERRSASYTEQAWIQLRQYTKDYSVLNGYQVVLDADQALYADDATDITEEILQYINKCYAGGN